MTRLAIWQARPHRPHATNSADRSCAQRRMMMEEQIAFEMAIQDAVDRFADLLSDAQLHAALDEVIERARDT